MKKVYCDDCKYCWCHPWDGFQFSKCKHERATVKIVEHNWFFDGAEERQVKHPNTPCCAMKNENNDCKDYKRKWWKFWKKGINK